MRPHDVVVLLKIICLADTPWLNKDLAKQLYLSPSEITESLNRSKIALLVTQNKKKVMRQSLLEFLQSGIQYVFPVEIGAVKRGFATAHSAMPLKESFSSTETYVWAHPKGTERGHTIPPLYSGAIQASLEDIALYQMLSLVDAIRIGKTREKELAYQELKARIL